MTRFGPCLTELLKTWLRKGLSIFLLKVLFSLGAIAILNKRVDAKPHDFTLVEIYGGAHLSVEKEPESRPPNNDTSTPELTLSLVTERIAGDDTGHLHVPPKSSAHWTQVQESCKDFIPSSRFYVYYVVRAL